MLQELHIENFAIIQELELQFQSGLVIVTGETGAGKSILLDAIMALVGGRVDADMVRSGADKAILEAVFSIPKETASEIHEILKREDLDDSADTLSLGREIRLETRNIARVNGRSVNVGLLKELGNFLVDIHGQAEHLSLLDVHSHLSLLDRFAGVEIELADYQKNYDELIKIRKELNSLRTLEAEAERKSEFLRFQAQEIESASLKEGEEEDLEIERNRLSNAENLAAASQQALVLLDEGGPEAQSITDMLGEVTQLLASLSRIDGSKKELTTEAGELSSQVAEMARELRSYLEEIEFNPRRLEQVENRLDLIHQLKRKYGGSIQSVVAFGQDARRQLETISNAGERISELEMEETSAVKDLTKAGELLSQKRSKAAEILAKEVETELDALSMKGAKFQVQIETIPSLDENSLDSGKKIAFNRNGFDQVEFLIAPNPGEGLKPLVKIASGGETSRLMLALKNVLAKADYVPTLIFDEIDQGIGGRVGYVVGEKLWKLSRDHQVMCVTHLPQLAAFGSQHFNVRKQVSSGRTSTEVEALTENKRVVELAQMAGNTSESNLNAARELLLQAGARKKELVVS